MNVVYFKQTLFLLKHVLIVTLIAILQPERLK